MKIVFFGTPKEVIPVLENVIKNFTVAAVVTTPDQKSGRKQLLTPSPIKAFAQKQNLPVITPHHFTDEIIQQLQNVKPDLFIVAAYGKIIPEAIIKLPKHGSINIHPSLLPKYRGPTPLQTALLNGESETGITFIKMDAKMDHGAILHHIPFRIEPTDTFDWLMQSTFAQAGTILPHVIERYISGELQPEPQDDSSATYTKIITKEDGYIDFDNPPSKEKLDRMIRAYYPWPTTWTKITIKNQEVRIKFLPKEKLQVEGKNPMSIKDFSNGYPEFKDKITKLFL
jgi:methionyl-tRNA formyltransferase